LIFKRTFDIVITLDNVWNWKLIFLSASMYRRACNQLFKKWLMYVDIAQGHVNLLGIIERKIFNVNNSKPERMCILIFEITVDITICIRFGYKR
jgi:hypothetical protein